MSVGLIPPLRYSANDVLPGRHVIGVRSRLPSDLLLHLHSSCGFTLVALTAPLPNARSYHEWSLRCQYFFLYCIAFRGEADWDRILRSAG